jgi:hypothetical protein
LYQQALQSYGPRSDLTRLLERAAEHANYYAGAIFGCAEISGATEYSQSELYHFGSRFFAPLGRFHLFQHPLPSETFADYVKIGQNTTTPLYGQQFDRIKILLAEQNRLPNFLRMARFGTLSFRTINQDNWLSISCTSNTRFIHEAQIRSYLLDYLLSEVKDPGTPLLEECQCYRDGDKTGIADYFIKVHGRWLPVEAKLNILTERELLAQVAKYTEIDAFVPTQGTQRTQQFSVDRHALCIVVDQSGIYVTKGGEFFRCQPALPIWQREALGHSSGLQIRAWIHEHSP